MAGAVRLARSVVDSDHAPFMERELAWAVLALARGPAGKAAGVQIDAREGVNGGENAREASGPPTGG